MQSFKLKMAFLMFVHVRHMNPVARKPYPEVIQLFQAQLNLSTEHELSTANRNEMLKKRYILLVVWPMLFSLIFADV